MNDSLASSESAPLPAQPVRQRRTIRRDVQLSLTVAFFILSGLVATQVKTQRNIRDSAARASQMQLAELGHWKKEAERLKQANESLQAKLNNLLAASEQESKQAKILATELEKVKMAMGLMPVKGRGLLVTLNDNPKMPKDAPPIEKDLYLVHDWQILQVVNELRSAGAEAIAVNGRRLGVNSYVRCVGLVIRVDDVRIGAPYKIEAIGDPEALRGALEAPGGILDEFRNNTYILSQVTAQEAILLPAIEGTPSFKHAKPAETTDKQEKEP
ncbi:MAG: DUF881 domain-containing protein [Abditibacteriales bacterium]|nr:DUF881 domain-containing protein [Abditibacteriales bacterium]MDW8367039.1 DUF881 domain-containing protein [Abditibacteriales bacterium]